MRKLLSPLLIAMLISCSPEPIITEIKTEKSIEPQTSTFKVKWESNQEGAYIELNKMHFKDCNLTINSTEYHREKEFEVTLDNGQPFDIQIKRTATVKNPELYLSISKGDDLQYEREITSYGFLLSTWVDGNGNILN